MPFAAETFHFPHQNAGNGFAGLLFLEHQFDRLDESENALVPISVERTRRTATYQKPLAVRRETRIDDLDRVIEQPLHHQDFADNLVATLQQKRLRLGVAGEKTGRVAPAVEAEIERIVWPMRSGAK